MVYFHADWRPRRSVLFMPASNERALQKAPTLACDSLIFDLEDAIAEGQQETARQNLLSLVKGRDFNAKERVIRISEVGSADHEADLKTAFDCEPDAILVPKVESTSAIKTMDSALKSAPPGLQLWIMIETPAALINLAELAKTAKQTRLACMVIGPNDLSRTTGTRMVEGRAPMVPWLMQMVAAARAYDLCVLDGVYNRFRDLEGLQQECAQGAEMGFDGKTLIHPNQIEAANEAFGPSPEDISRAKQIVELFSKPENKDLGAIQLDGEMVERLHLGMAKRLLEAFSHEEKS